MDSDAPRDLTDLADAYLADALDAFERADFERRLHEDEDARDALIAAARRDLSLRRALTAMGPAAKEAPPRRTRVRAARSRPSVFPWIVAAALLIGFAASVILMSGPAQPPVAPRPTTARVSPPQTPKAPPPPSPVPQPMPTPPPASDEAAVPPSAPPVQTSPLGTPPVAKQKEAVPAMPAPATKPRPESAPTVAKPHVPTILLERITGRVMRVTQAGLRPARTGATIAPGEGIRTAPTRSTATIKLSDGTRLHVGADTEIRLDPADNRVRLPKGRLTADVAPQNPAKPLRFETPHGTAVVLGTHLRLYAYESHTRLEVTEGRVRLERGSNSQIVSAGQYGIVEKSGAVVTDGNPPETITVNFGPSDAPVPPDVVTDTGEPFDPARGYGWDLPRGTVTKRTGRYHTDTGLDVLRASIMSVGSNDRIETWEMHLPDGRYLVSISVGDPKYEQGPHHVWIEGRQVVNNRITLAGRYFILRNVPVEIRDGALTMKAGGQRSGKLAEDKTTDTTLNFLVIQRLSRIGEK